MSITSDRTGCSCLKVTAFPMSILSPFTFDSAVVRIQVLCTKKPPKVTYMTL